MGRLVTHLEIFAPDARARACNCAPRTNGSSLRSFAIGTESLWLALVVGALYPLYTDSRRFRTHG